MARVLVVEDDAWIAWMIADDLADRGYEVSTARDGAEALRRLKTTRPDAIVLDLQLPHLDGPGFVRELRDHPGRGRVPLLVVSGAAQAADAAERLGAEALVPKPFDLNELLGAVHRVSHAQA